MLNLSTGNNTSIDYSFGKVGETKYIYYNNTETHNCVSRDIYNWKGTQNITANNCTIASDGFNVSLLNKIVNPINNTYGSFTSNPGEGDKYKVRLATEDTSGILNNWYQNYYNNAPDNIFNTLEYGITRNLPDDYPLYGSTAFWQEENKVLNYVTHCRLRFPIKRLLQDNHISENEIKGRVFNISGQIFFNNNSNEGPDSGYLRTRIINYYNTDSNGYKFDYFNCIYDHLISFRTYTETFADSASFEIPIAEGQEYIILDIESITDISNTQALKYGYNLDLYFRTYSYSPAYTGDFYTAPNQYTLYLAGTDSNTNELSIRNDFSNLNCYPKNKIENNLINLGDNCIYSRIFSDQDKSLKIDLNWETGEFYGYYFNNKDNTPKQYFLKESTGLEKFSVSATTEVNFIFDGFNNNAICLSIIPAERKITKLPIINSNGTIACSIINTTSTVSLLSSKDSIISDLANLRQEVANLRANANLVNLVYKVGDYFITEDNVNPGLRFGGTWELVSERFLLGATTNEQIGSEGGSNTLTVDQMPAHNHNVIPAIGNNSWIGNRNGQTKLGWENAGNRVTTEIVGGNQPHKHPYRYVYLWRKTSNDADPSLSNFSTPYTGLYKLVSDNAVVGDIRIKYTNSKTPWDNTWLKCDGSNYDTSLYKELYEILNTDVLPLYSYKSYVIKTIENPETETNKNSSYYRLYSDGFIEQGGTYEVQDQANSLSTATFLVPFKNTSYICNATATDSDDATNTPESRNVWETGREIAWGERTVNSIKFGTQDGHSRYHWICWEARGYISEETFKELTGKSFENNPIYYIKATNDITNYNLNLVEEKPGALCWKTKSEAFKQTTLTYEIEIPSDSNKVRGHIFKSSTEQYLDIPSNATLTILTYTCENIAGLKTLYKFIFDWSKKSYSFWTDDTNSEVDDPMIPKSEQSSEPLENGIITEGTIEINGNGNLTFNNNYHIISIPLKVNTYKISVFEFKNYFI